MIYRSSIDCIGNTPIISLDRLAQHFGLNAQLFAKVEFFNPSGSSKDRAALFMLEAAEQRGEIREGATVIAATSGNTGIALAAICAVKGYNAIIVKPDNTSIERVKLLQAYGAVVELTPSAQGVLGAVERAEQLHNEIENSLVLDQFSNADNPKAHEKTTALEIIRDMGVPNVFVSAVGTGGTFSGTARGLKEQGKVYAVAVEPSQSPLLSEGRIGQHGILGIGPNFIPQTLDMMLIDEVFAVSTEDAKDMMELLAKKEGLFCGISSGAALFAAVELAKCRNIKNERILTVLADTGERYLSLL